MAASFPKVARTASASSTKRSRSCGERPATARSLVPAPPSSRRVAVRRRACCCCDETAHEGSAGRVLAHHLAAGSFAARSAGQRPLPLDLAARSHGQLLAGLDLDAGIHRPRDRSPSPHRHLDALAVAAAARGADEERADRDQRRRYRAAPSGDARAVGADDRSSLARAVHPRPRQRRNGEHRAVWIRLLEAGRAVSRRRSK